MALSQVYCLSRKPGGKYLFHVFSLMRRTEILKSCVLCPNEGGAFKQTIHGEWVHLLCAIWVPETRVANEVFMEPITGLDRVSKQRWKLVSNVSTLLLGGVSVDALRYTEMLCLQHPRRSVHPMQQDFLFSCISCNMCPEGEVLDAYEKHTGGRGGSAHMFLREALTCMLTSLLLHIRS
jgi:hypothetical protein